MIHDLKIAPQWFAAHINGEKTFEIRSADRPFGVGDTLKLREFDVVRGEYSGREIEREVVGVLHGPAYGLAEGFCILSVTAAAPMSAQPSDAPAPRKMTREAIDRAASYAIESDFLAPEDWEAAGLYDFAHALTGGIGVVDDLRTLVARLVRSLRQAAPGNDLADKAVDYLRRHGLAGSPLRHAAAPGSGVEQDAGVRDA